MFKRIFLSGTFFLISILSCLAQSENNSSERYYVGLRNGEVIYAKTLKYKNPVFASPYLLVDGVDKYDVDFVKYYQDNTGYYMWAKVNDFESEVKLKREISGEISAYYRIVTRQSYSPDHGVGFSSQRLDYYQKRGHSINKINYRNLKSGLSDNIHSTDKLNEVKNLRLVD